MRWEGREESQNVEDQRGRGIGGGTVAVGGIGGLVLVVLGLLLGVDPREVLPPNQQQQPQQNPQGQKAPEDPVEEKMARFSKVVFRDTEVVWDDLFRQMGKRYQKPTLVLFTGQVESACGRAQAAIGPFYCPGDAKVYIDLSFYRDMERQLNAPGEFARAYVIAHEVGHHVQHLLGYSQRVEETRRSLPKSEHHKLTVRLELQADFLAGVWAHHGQRRFNFLEKGDIDAAMKAAFEIGDDRLQKKSRGYVVPDSFTHGTSKQRTFWFMDGYKTGNVSKAAVLFERPYDEL